MILISHRGNIAGPKPDRENHPSYILEALAAGFDVEVDVWSVDGELFLGHDMPQYEVSIDFLKNDHLWCHAKNLEALSAMLSCEIHCFWHQEDDYTLTSRGFIWTFPNKNLTTGSICVKIGKRTDDFSESIAGVCSDWIKTY
jgi:hypothetical protein